jgi:sec-independent protein translocase protein TatC
MAKVLRPIGHEERLSIVDHLDELRSRLVISGIALVIAFAVCFWQNQPLLKVLNRALPHASSTGLGALPKDTATARAGLLKTANYAAALARAPGLSAAARAAANGMAAADRETAQSFPKSVSEKDKPITIGVGEPFTTTLTVAFYFALLFTLPLLLYQVYAFVIPALKPQEKRVAVPVMLAAPLLFVGGVAFAYGIVLPPAVRFLQGYNSTNFQILVQAKTYYTFEIFTMLGVGLAFQLPLALLALDRVGVLNGRTLIKNWRYATVIIAVLAAAMPGADPVTTALEMLPLILLYLASIVMLTVADRRAARRASSSEIATIDDGLDPT